MSNIDKRALREVAGKATPGPWLWINTGSFFSFLVSESNQDPHQCIIDDGTAWGEYGETINPESHDGVFIAAANPATVLALLDELEAKDKCIAEQVEIIAKQDKWIKDVEATMISATDRAEVAENRVTELEAMLARLYTECDTGERRGNGSQSGVAMPSWVTVEAARLLLGVK
ncbi:ead/Ea22-like family protein [Enterobacter cancerogenus]|uniref:ead/Ea22-like family protein n=1 Tax=Enterobacter cancerogenus TaxID=69218 RepID=UPI004058B6E0